MSLSRLHSTLSCLPNQRERERVVRSSQSLEDKQLHPTDVRCPTPCPPPLSLPAAFAAAVAAWPFAFLVLVAPRSKYMELFDAPHEEGAGARSVEGCFGESLAFVDELVKVGRRRGGERVSCHVVRRLSCLRSVSVPSSHAGQHTRVSHVLGPHPTEGCPRPPRAGCQVVPSAV